MAGKKMHKGHKGGLRIKGFEHESKKTRKKAAKKSARRKRTSRK